MRSAKDNEIFPYCSSLLCYFEVYKDGKVIRINHKNKSDIQNVINAYYNATEGITTLYAVWPGKWSSDLFIIDDLETFAKSFGILEKEQVGV